LMTASNSSGWCDDDLQQLSAAPTAGVHGCKYINIYFPANVHIPLMELN
jgi:hypothetical protein